MESLQTSHNIAERAVTASSLLRPDGAVARGLVGAEVRPAQLAMADAVERAIVEPGARLLVEAPTGTGKSLAYLCAAATARRHLDGEPLRVVVATGTKALQDQLALHDAPHLCDALARVGQRPPVVEVVKGRRNYLCRLRLSRWQPGLALEPRVGVQVQQIRRWVDSTEVGDRAEIAGLPDDSPVWSELDADADACVGQSCEFHASCFITRLRQRAREAHIIITNHHLLCADLRLRFTGGAADARVLPPYDALIIDEAHRLPMVAAEHFGVGLGAARIDALCRDAMRILASHKAPAARSAVVSLAQGAGALFTSVGQALAGSPDAARVPFRVPDHGPSHDAAVRVREALAAVEAQMDAFGSLRRETLAEAEAVARRARAIDDDLKHLSAAEDERFAFCGERRGPRGRLSAYPADVAELLRNTLLGGAEPVVFTSATLAVGGDFRGYCDDVGLEEGPLTSTLALPPTFEADQAVLYVPRDMPDPDAAAFSERVAARVVELVELTEGGAFLLCTTNRAMNHYAGLLHKALPKLSVLKQGEAPKVELLERFKRDGNAVLVATHSFWEGVDVRGQALRLVMVDKLPFAPPSDPLVAARASRAERQGRDAFRDVQLGDAILTLRQGLGRLLRSREDRGILAIFDGRLWRRSYGRRVMSALGGHPVVGVWEELEAHARRLELIG